MGILNKLKLVFTYGEELESVLKYKREEAKEAERLARIHHLNLCKKHQQERNRSHYSEHNCDYCKLQKRLGAIEETT